MKAYYDARAPEYDDWYYGSGQFGGVARPGWDEELRTLAAALAAVPAARTLDVACGTGFLTRHLRGAVTGLDQSGAMLAEFARRVPDAATVRADALAPLPFPDDAFERLVTGHFYGHLRPHERVAFVREARRVAGELFVVDSALREDVEPEGVQERVLQDGSRWSVYKRYFEPAELAAELGGGAVVHAGRWFVAVRCP
ncbi:MAG: class I SAM-dependent methyltransferase [Thermoleophilia bacterium]|nr:class I SAM-dependent methyltransferase [Thermoleophilia bacterium]